MPTNRPPPGSRPTPAPVLRLGVTGHRPNRLAESALPRLRRQIGEVIALLESIAGEAQAAHAEAGIAERPALLRALSALAEGADTLVAEIALERGAALEAPLPFAVAEYERDFPAGPPRECFHRLLGRAARVFPLGGTRERAAEAYEAAGRLVVERCDVLLAIWDGGPAAGPGGTALIAAYAQELGVPVIWIHATRERPPCLLASDAEAARKVMPIEALRGRLLTKLASAAR
ncbi:MAG TPA: hypothetical protein VN980_13725 [Alphaproteobacteria bacterium]|nr:hypothetical protein [Alphaproteobacteria bacterium]